MAIPLATGDEAAMDYPAWAGVAPNPGIMGNSSGFPTVPQPLTPPIPHSMIQHGKEAVELERLRGTHAEPPFQHHVADYAGRC
jgi:hypothetical protein